MKIKVWLKDNSLRLSNLGIESSRLDCLILLEDILKKDRAWILANPDYDIKKPQLKMLENLIERRLTHEPIAYIRGKSEFYGIELSVKNTLVPRPETETLIELALDKIDNNVKQLVDIGTGSGAIAIALKLNLPEIKVIATDSEVKALNTAKLNADRHSAEINFLIGNLLDPIIATNNDFSHTALVANLPYVPTEFTLNKAAYFEPSIAIFGGNDGLKLYHELFEQIGKLSSKPLLIFTESLEFQHARLKEIAENSGYKEDTKKGLIQIFKL